MPKDIRPLGPSMVCIEMQSEDEVSEVLKLAVHSDNSPFKVLE